MSNHERFEELCVMAAAGEISVSEQRELMAHIEECASCRRTFADMKDIHSMWLPQREGVEIKRSFATESRLRQRIVLRVAAEGAEFSSEARLPADDAAHLTRPSYQDAVHRLLPVAAIGLIVLVGVGIHRGVSARRSASSSAGAQSLGSVSQRSSPSVAGTPQIEILPESAQEAELAQVKLETTLKEAEADRKRLQQELDDAEARAMALQQSSAATAQELANLRQQLDSARASESSAIDQLAALKASSSEQQTELALLEGENSDLRGKLSEQAPSADRERELMADGREIRDLIAARNLHIIDVYDTSGGGQTQKSFGRVFYTEGKSLVFYAYDLPSRRPSTQYAFYAWGKRDGNGDVNVRNLGIFYNDDQTQKRWVLKITDPHALSEIDSVFVTLEKTHTGVENAPTGKKLLTAYLGSPANHP